MPRLEARGARHQRSPTRPGARGRIGILLGRGVEADPGDLDEGVTWVRVDGDPLAEPAASPRLELARVHRDLEQAGGVQHVRDRAGAVVARVVPPAVAAAVDVGL